MLLCEDHQSFYPNPILFSSSSKNRWHITHMSGELWRYDKESSSHEDVIFFLQSLLNLLVQSESFILDIHTPFFLHSFLFFVSTFSLTIFFTIIFFFSRYWVLFMSFQQLIDQHNKDVCELQKQAGMVHLYSDFHCPDCFSSKTSIPPFFLTIFAYFFD